MTAQELMTLVGEIVNEHKNDLDSDNCINFGGNLVMNGVHKVLEGARENAVAKMKAGDMVGAVHEANLGLKVILEAVNMALAAKKLMLKMEIVKNTTTDDNIPEPSSKLPN